MGNFASKNTQLDVTSGAGHVSINGAITAISGTLVSQIMVPTDANLVGPGTDSAAKLWGSATGCKAYRFKALAAITATHALIHQSSITAGADLSGTLNTADGKVTAGDGVALSGVVVQTTGEEVGAWILWDGTDTIKTIACRLSVGATPAQVILETIV